ncbi:MAG: hypothetical protein NTW38_10710 [Candidatus Aminicenantes bacterium]|nr:hypothetical protein [Candidatus Aminicenantes bacterium]
MEFSRVLVGLVVVLWSLVVGLSIVAFGQILLAIREIALNTRKEEAAHHPGTTRSCSLWRRSTTSWGGSSWSRAFSPAFTS